MFIWILYFIAPGSLLAQQPYQLSWARETACIGGGGLGFGLSHWIGKRQKPLDASGIADLNLSHIPPFDRIATRHYSFGARKASDWALRTSALLPLLLLTDPHIRRDAGTVSVLLGEVFLVNLALTNLSKVTAHRTRPFVYNPAAPMTEKVKVDARRSFFSGHTSVAAAMSFATATIWCDYHPNSKWKPAVWAGAALAPATVGFLRVKGGKHFPTDVLTGLVVGAATGYLVPRLHKIKG